MGFEQFAPGVGHTQRACDATLALNGVVAAVVVDDQRALEVLQHAPGMPTLKDRDLEMLLAHNWRPRKDDPPSEGGGSATGAAASAAAPATAAPSTVN